MLILTSFDRRLDPGRMPAKGVLLNDCTRRVGFTTVPYLAAGKVPERVDSRCPTNVSLPRTRKMSDDEAMQDYLKNAALNVSEEVPLSRTFTHRVGGIPH